MLSILVITSLILALIPAVLFCANFRAYVPPPSPKSKQDPPSISVLIPARNEEKAIGAAVRSVLASTGVELEIIVLDDHSEDSTASIVEKLAECDDRVRLISGPELPIGWCGKQYACWVLAQEARHPLIVFLDADVRLTPDALVRMAEFVRTSRADLASGIPHQVTVGLMEKLLIPLIHFILLGFLAIGGMRRCRWPPLSAGCGQLFIARRDAYDRCGGHSVIRDSLHDGIKLPRAFRASGFRTDLFDATDLASCRMYRTSGEVWFGLSKNAGEALAAPATIGPITLILLGGQVVPLVFLFLGLISLPEPWPDWQLALATLTTLTAYYPRLAAAARFRQSWLGALFHPLGIVILVAIQWFAFLRNVLGRPSRWRGRDYVVRSSKHHLATHRDMDTICRQPDLRS
jgi:hypothetical protein